MRPILLLISLLFIANVSGQGAYSTFFNEIPDSRLAYKEGEKLLYTVKYTWGIFRTDVGEAIITIDRKSNGMYGDHFHSVITGYSYKFYDVFFKIRDVFEAKFSAATGRPLYFHRDISEGRYRLKNTLYFNPDNSIRAKVKRKEEPERETLLNGKGHTFDLVSFLYHTRNLDFTTFAPGVEHPFYFAIDDDIFNLNYKFVGKEIKNIPGLGTFNTLKFVAKVVAGEVFKGKEELVIWVSDDRNKVPLLIESPIKVGRVTGRLSSFENLKFPLSSMIERSN